MQDYRKLKVWEKAHAFAVELHETCKQFGRRDGAVVANQLRRASLSIAANIAEGAGKGSDREFRRFLQISMGSALEADYHLLVARDTHLLGAEGYETLSGRLFEIRRMLGGLIKRIDLSLHDNAPVVTPSVPKQPTTRDDLRHTE